MKKWLFFFVFSAALFSCKSARIAPQRTETVTTISDSTATRLITVDTLKILRPKESVSLSARFRELSSTPTVRKQGAATITQTRIGETIETICECDELRVQLEVQKEITEFYRTIATKTLQETTITQNKMPGWAKIPVYVGCTVIILAFVGLFMYIRGMPKQIVRNTLNSN